MGVTVILSIWRVPFCAPMKQPDEKDGNHRKSHPGYANGQVGGQGKRADGVAPDEFPDATGVRGNIHDPGADAVVSQRRPARRPEKEQDGRQNHKGCADQNPTVVSGRFWHDVVKIAA